MKRITTLVLSALGLVPTLSYADFNHEALYQVRGYDVAVKSAYNQANVVMSRSSSANRNWHWEGQNIRLLTNQGRDWSNYCLNAYRPRSGSNVNIYTCDQNDPEQHWVTRNDGLIELKGSGLCLNSYRTAEGSNLNLYYCNASDPDQKIVLNGVKLLQEKQYPELDSTDMKARYTASLKYYEDNETELKEHAYSLLKVFDALHLLEDETLLTGLIAVFWELEMPNAAEALYRFLYKDGARKVIDIDTVLKEGCVIKSVYDTIVEKYDAGQRKGSLVVQQYDWGLDRWCITGTDEKYAYGTLTLNWAADNDGLILYTQDIYSFNIDEKSKERPTLPLYKAAGKAVLAGEASDYWIVGKTSKMSIDSARSKAK